MTDQELERIGNYVQDHLPEWMDGERSPGGGPREARDEARERLIRLEEAISRQGDLIEKMLHQMDMRFEQTNRRIDDMNRLMDMRIEQVNRRIDELAVQVNRRIDELTLQMNRRIDELTLQMNIRFEQMEDRIERVDKRISRMFTVLTTISSIIGAAVVLAQFIG